MVMRERAICVYAGAALYCVVFRCIVLCCVLLCCVALCCVVLCCVACVFVCLSVFSLVSMLGVSHPGSNRTANDGDKDNDHETTTNDDDEGRRRYDEAMAKRRLINNFDV